MKAPRSQISRRSDALKRGLPSTVYLIQSSEPVGKRPIHANTIGAFAVVISCGIIVCGDSTE